MEPIVTHFGLILGMMAVTFLPRMVPLVFLKDVHLPPAVQRFLDVLPVCALGALILPNVLSATPTQPAAGIVGSVVAALVSLATRSMLLAVISGVGSAYLMLVFF
jgi:branched-subunit amino acid transport protein